MTGPQGRVAGVSFVDFFYFLAATVSHSISDDFVTVHSRQRTDHIFLYGS
ncbi:Uncharacterised protein [Klebsiella variicola]|uniref:Uncharacterized protein n=1 Tax=Klebsiella variicola TaxID=244366 RepID=A0A7H4MJM2_KLEVA|nr:hypothetical protein A1WC_02301 [Klebsiella sp. KTE92]ESL90103.1 hypothetical protein L421_02410 [Klebsiella variicola]MBB3334881.1 hypothetical protein [Klebsiella sp. RC2]EWD81858.1 hypothetical protein P821_01569 [Klebsiella variicola]KDM36992.1 hypothetical protein AE02_01484 [Klebsiella variicola]